MQVVLRRTVSACTALALALSLVPLLSLQRAQALEGEVSFSSYSMYAYREAGYGIQPDAQQNTAGCHFVIEAAFPAEVTVADPLAAAACFAAPGVMTGSIGTVAYVQVSARDNVLVVDVCASHLPGGDVTITPLTIQGVTCGGAAVAWPAFSTIVPTGLKLHTTSVTVGTATTCASTTVQVDHQANIRSMNHILWTSNGSSILSGAGTAQTTAAHHHNYWSITLPASAGFIQQYASLDGYTITSREDTVTITANVAREGEYLGIYNYDDDFLQAHGLTLADAVTGLEVPQVVAGRSLVDRCDVQVGETASYTGEAVEPTVAVTDRYRDGVDNAPLVRGVDYEVTCTNNVELGSVATLVIQGLGEYAGSSVTRSFTVTRDLERSMFSVDTASVVYQGVSIMPTVTSVAGLEEGRDYTVSYLNNHAPGTASIIISGAGLYGGTLTYEFTIEKIALDPSMFTVDTKARAYTGTAIKPAVSSTLPSALYEVTYANNVKAGTGTVKIAAKGTIYGGTLTYHFPIKPAKPKVTKAKPGKRKIVVKWSCASAQGYVVYYRAAGAKKWSKKATAKKTLTLSKLKKGKKYKVKVVAKAGGTTTVSKVITSKKVK